MTTLITGGAGFIGSQLAARLLQSGEPVVLLDNFQPYYDPAIKRKNVAELPGNPLVIEGDIRDEALIEQVFRNHSIRRVAHMAAMSNVRYSIDKGRLYSDVNTSATVTLMDAARKHKVSTFVFASTSSVYGSTTRIPFVEDDAAGMPLAPYPASKRAAEIFAYSYYQLFGLNVSVLRLFNVYGPYGRPDMMPLRVIEAILKGDSIPIYDGGKLKRDWTYISDVLDGVIAALERPLGYSVMNLGFGAPIPLTDFIQIYEKLIGKKAITHDVPAPSSEPFITYCDNTRAHDLLDFQPKVDVEEGLAYTWAWYKKAYNIS